MRDIRKDLLDRLNGIEAELSTLLNRTSELEQEKALTRQILDIENVRWQKQPTGGQAEVPQKEGPVLSEYISRLLANGHVWTLNAIREKALSDGYLGDSFYPGRSVHALLVNLKKRGLAKQLGEGKWKKATASEVNHQ
ncbi:MAG: hypothetical protein HQ504_13100 [Rhodospirillaceae bacterium]|nr:hypothetical protein [Rhodospirillaceae bacterium]